MSANSLLTVQPPPSVPDAYLQPTPTFALPDAAYPELLHASPPFLPSPRLPVPPHHSGQPNEPHLLYSIRGNRDKDREIKQQTEIQIRRQAPPVRKTWLKSG